MHRAVDRCVYDQIFVFSVWEVQGASYSAEWIRVFDFVI